MVYLALHCGLEQYLFIDLLTVVFLERNRLTLISMSCLQQGLVVPNNRSADHFHKHPLSIYAGLIMDIYFV